MIHWTKRAAIAAYFAACSAGTVVAADPLPDRHAFFGDLHLHTTYSFDAYVLMGTKVDPDTAYRFAKGDEVEYMGKKIQRREPLDFLAVTDHSENIGVFNQLENPDSAFSKTQAGKDFKAAIASRDVGQIYAAMDRYILNGKKLPDAITSATKSAWAVQMDAANRNYTPGKFTTFIAYEWTSMVQGANLHRNVIFKGDTAPAPFTSVDSRNAEDLWNYLEKARAAGHEALAIPHNGNASNGLMYDWTRLDGGPIDHAYAARRQVNEPLAEISQGKGTSEAFPALSSNDEFSNFEIFDFLLVDTPVKSKPEGSYVRDALGRGLVLQNKVGANPYKYGFVGGSDLHGGLSVSAQADYAGNIGAVNLGGGKPTKEQAAASLEGKGNLVTGWVTTAGNLTGVWAESNTRDSIYSALRRKEAFATSGTRIQFRFFGGWDFDKKLLQQRDWVQKAYAAGVPMGSDLPPKAGKAKAPSFAIWSLKDPNAANLDRLQVVKVWEEDGKQREKIFDVSWSGNRTIDTKTGKLPPVGDTVDLKTGAYKNNIGAAELKTMWTDPEFNPNTLAAYYLRVLEIPTPRWSTLLALEHGLPLPKDSPATVQQRGWSSPIWYTPQGL